MIVNENLYSLFEKSVDVNSLNIALLSRNRSINYEELYRKANNFADYFISNQIEKEEIVCIIGVKSFELIACILGVIQAGGAYFIIDPDTPVNRIRFLLEDSKSRFVLSKNADIEKFSEFKAVGLEDIYKKNVIEKISCMRKESSLAYLIYTSGTSGTPKGVMIEDRNLIAYIESYCKMFNVQSNDRVLQLSPCFFDGFGEEVFSMLLTGGCLVLPDNHVSQSPRLIKKEVDEFKITIMATTPLILNELNKLEKMSSLRVLISAGDILKSHYYSNLVKYVSVYNMYGPSEATVVATCYKCTINDDFEPPIGRPLLNYEIEILNEKLQSAPLGELGEIYITGKAVARGYLNNEEMTRQRFIIIDGKRMYKTGDAGAMRHDGNIEFKGRNDRQVKFNCHRIEMPEIECTALKYEKLKDAVAIVKDVKDDEKRICIFYTSEDIIDEEKLRSFFNENLPSYMVPSHIQRLESIPLSLTGKVDYNALSNMINLPHDIFISNAQDSEEYLFLRTVASCIDGKTLDFDLALDNNLVDSGINSITFVQIVVSLEEAFGIEFDDEYLVIGSFQCFIDLYNYVISKVNPK
jgi:amino acid adenylation domain-containing protein